MQVSRLVLRLICPKCGRGNDDGLYSCLYCYETLRKDAIRPENVANVILTSLKVMGENVQLIEGIEDCSWYKSKDGRKLCVIGVNNRPFNRIIARQALYYTSRAAGSRTGPSSGTFMDYEIAFVVDADAFDFRKELEVEPSFKYEGFFKRGKTLDVRWKGGLLAEQLNVDFDIKRRMLEAHPRHRMEGYSSRVYVSFADDHPMIQVIGVQLTYNLYELIGCIANHIREIVGQRQPDTPQ